MPTTRKQKEARKSRGVEMLSDIENLGIMLGGNNPEKEEIEYGNLFEGNRFQGFELQPTQYYQFSTVWLLTEKPGRRLFSWSI